MLKGRFQVIEVKLFEKDKSKSLHNNCFQQERAYKKINNFCKFFSLTVIIR